MSITDKLKNTKIAEFWLKYEQKIILFVGVVLIAAISFEAGFLHGQKSQSESVIVNKVASAETARASKEEIQTDSNTAKTSAASPKSASSETTASSESQKCAYVASKNSNKYHLPTCRYAQNIKPENKVCFSSKEDAESKGFQGAKCCIK